jgi:pimeloyl-ACP methyl ester carboxylesterase
MTAYTHQSAPTQFVEAGGIRFAYRRFGKAGGAPLVFNQHFIGTMDYWDPAVTDGLGKEREVILFDNAGVSSSSGEVPTTFEEMGADAIAFIKALGLTKVDVLGFSIGGFVAQEITLQATGLVRRLVLVGTGPRGGHGMATLTPERSDFRRDLRSPDELWLRVHFTESERPGRRSRVSEAIPAPDEEPRPRGERESRARPDRSNRQVGRAAWGSYDYLSTSRSRRWW